MTDEQAAQLQRHLQMLIDQYALAIGTTLKAYVEQAFHEAQRAGDGEGS